MAQFLAILLLLPPALEIVGRAICLPLPGSVTGYFLLLAWLIWANRIPEDLSAVSTVLIRLLPICLVPPAIGIAAQSTVRARDLAPLVAAVLLGTVAGLILTAVTFHLCSRHQGVKCQSLGRLCNL